MFVSYDENQPTSTEMCVDKIVCGRKSVWKKQDSNRTNTQEKKAGARENKHPFSE